MEERVKIVMNVKESSGQYLKGAVPVFMKIIKILLECVDHFTDWNLLLKVYNITQ